MELAVVISQELALPRAGVERTLALLGEGATIPFLARYRKEQTGNLDEVQLRSIEERAHYLTELAARKKTVLETIGQQGKLTDELRARITQTLSKTELEDLYLPFKPKRRTRATIALERGLEPLADLIWAQEAQTRAPRDALVRPFVAPDREVPDAEAAWQGARDIVAARIAELADVRADLREQALADGALRGKAAPVPKKGAAGATTDKVLAAAKFSDYADHSEPVRHAPSHRILALLRGEEEGHLRVGIEVEADVALAAVRHRAVANPRAALADQFDLALVDAYERLLQPSIEIDVRMALKARADLEAIRVFADNLKALLFSAPFGPQPVLALDPGFRTGCKVVVLSGTGDLLEHTVVYPHEPQQRAAEARRTLAGLAAKHRVRAVAVGNGTAGRESLALVKAMRGDGELPEGCVLVSVNESGASIYSASDLAREELPDQDVTVRGAVSIGRRLQDPLAELVKIDPKSIGVGQYQHDVDQAALKRSLDGVVESCVNGVGVNVNTASPKLLAYVAGIGETLARNIVAYRAEHGPLRSRQALRQVPRLGAKAFEQAAGFLRVRGGDNPLDASGVHPESYDVVQRMARDLKVNVAGLIGRGELLLHVNLKRYTDERRGEPTLRDILQELEKPGRDPRQEFEETGFRDDVTEIQHLVEGMTLAGVVTNVTAFGAFVDIGVHQDGLVHVSELSHRFVKDPSEVVKVGQVVQVTVLKVNLPRRRIGLSMKQGQPRPAGPPPMQGGPDRRGGPPPGRGGPPPGKGGGGGKPAAPQPAAKPATFNSIRIRGPR